MEGEDLLEEMLHAVGAGLVAAGGGDGGGVGTNGIPAVAAPPATVGGREPMGRCWHRVMLVPEEFTADALLQQQQQQSRGVADAGMRSLGPGGASSLHNAARMHTGAGAVSLDPAGSAELQPASPLHPPRVPDGGDTSHRSFQRKSMPNVTDEASPSSLRPSECDGVVPEDASNTSLPRRRASFVSNGGIDSAKMLRLASGEW